MLASNPRFHVPLINQRKLEGSRFHFSHASSFRLPLSEHSNPAPFLFPRPCRQSPKLRRTSRCAHFWSRGRESSKATTALQKGPSRQPLAWGARPARAASAARSESGREGSPHCLPHWPLWALASRRPGARLSSSDCLRCLAATSRTQNIASHFDVKASALGGVRGTCPFGGRNDLSMTPQSATLQERPL